jgi:hypothetical protein
MKRMTRRMIGAVIGLSLGWYVYGVVDPILTGKPSFGHEDKAAHQAAPGSAPGSAPAEPGKHAPAAGERPAQEGEAHAAQHLVPADGDAPFMGAVVWGTVALFSAGIVLGIPALALRGPEPPDPAAQHDDHAGHGHDDHAASSGHQMVH